MRERSELLELLNRNKAWDLPSYKLPQHKAGDLAKIEEAARAHALADNSDPFAFYRIRLYMWCGFELASDISKEAKSRLSRRAHEPHASFDALDTVKRSIDADRAWNQHRSSMYLEAAE